MSRALFVFAALPLLVLAACAGPRSSNYSSSGESNYISPNGAIRVTFRDYRSGLVMNLLNESHSDPVEFYSQPRNDASTKIQTDEIVDALLEVFDAKGFERMQYEGPAPQNGGGASRAIAVERRGRIQHIVFRPQDARTDRLAFNDCAAAFLEISNLTYGAQTVEGGKFSGVPKRN